MAGVCLGAAMNRRQREMRRLGDLQSVGYGAEMESAMRQRLLAIDWLKAQSED